MDDIMIDIPGLQERATRLNDLSKDTYRVVEQLVIIMSQLRPIWQDDAFQIFSDDVKKLILKLLQMQETTNKMAKICEDACNTYQKADDNILSMI